MFKALLNIIIFLLKIKEIVNKMPVLVFSAGHFYILVHINFKETK